MHLYTLTPFYYTEALLPVSTLNGPFSGSTFHEPGQQNVCPDVNIIFKSNILFVLCSDVNVQVYSEFLDCIKCNNSSTLIPLTLFI